MSGFVTTFSGYVMPAQCDHLGHMNVQHYFATVGEGVFVLQTAFGLGPSQIAARRLSLAVVHTDATFKSELVAGDVIRLDSGVIEVGTKSVTFCHHLIRIEDEKVAFEALFKTVLLDLDSRTAVALPDDIRAAVLRHQISVTENP
jgi:acyl-CoA thioesterase FadM